MYRRIRRGGYLQEVRLMSANPSPRNGITRCGSTSRRFQRDSWAVREHGHISSGCSSPVATYGRVSGLVGGLWRESLHRHTAGCEMESMGLRSSSQCLSIQPSVGGSWRWVVSHGMVTGPRSTWPSTRRTRGLSRGRSVILRLSDTPLHTAPACSQILGRLSD